MVSAGELKLLNPAARLSRVGDIGETAGDPDTGEELPLCVAILKSLRVMQARNN